MEDKENKLRFEEEILDSEIDEIWEILFPYAVDAKEKFRMIEEREKDKPRRYMRFLSM